MNGETASSRMVYTEAGMGNRWHLWEQALDAFREGIDTVEVEVEWLGDEGKKAGYAYLGKPGVIVGRIESI